MVELSKNVTLPIGFEFNQLAHKAHQHTALLIFARSVEEELKHKPFLSRKSLGILLHRHIKTVAKNSGMPVFYFDESKQQGDHFGTRFSNALQSIFKTGFDRLIVVGNDCPHLTAEHLHQASNALEKGAPVLGPTHDGGFYLMGLSKSQFEHQTFIQFSWNTKGLFQEVITHFQEKGHQCLTLKTFRDLDSIEAVRFIATTFIQDKTLRRCLRALQIQHSPLFETPKDFKQRFAHHKILNKGSPLILF